MESPVSRPERRTYQPSTYGGVDGQGCGSQAEGEEGGRRKRKWSVAKRLGRASEGFMTLSKL
jgi:hypothetical protein